MNFHILTLFPDMVRGGLETSITGRAIEAGTITLEAVNIRDFSTNKHKKVDDYPYGGGAGMLMQAQPVYDAYESVVARIPSGNKRRVIYVTPQGYPFTQRMAEDLAKNEDLIFLCVHYEGIDERVLEEIVTDYVSIGDYVLTGGELAAMVMIDAISRLVPGVLHNEVSAETESFHGELLEHPQYSRPEVWHGKAVPEVLLKGNQRMIDAWRQEASMKRTLERRPDLYEKYMALQNVKALLLKQKLLHIDMIELINRGNAILVAKDDSNIILQDKNTKIYHHTGDSVEFIKAHIKAGIKKNIEKLSLDDDTEDRESNSLEANTEDRKSDSLEANTLKEKHLDYAAKRKEQKGLSVSGLKIILHQTEFIEEVQAYYGLKHSIPCVQAVYTQREKLPVSGLYRPDGKPMENGLVILPLREEDLGVVAASFGYYSDTDKVSNGNSGSGTYLGSEEISAGAHPEGNAHAPAQSLEKGAGYFTECHRAGMLFGAYIEDKLAGFVGIHADGSMGLLHVLPEYQGRHIAKALETFIINYGLELGHIPYGQVVPTNEVSMHLQESLGLYFSKTEVAWVL